MGRDSKLISESLPRISWGIHCLLYMAISIGSFFGIIVVLIAVLSQVGAKMNMIFFIVLPFGGSLLARYLFAKCVPAECPDCDGKAYIERISGEIVYQCTECCNRHRTHLRFRGR